MVLTRSGGITGRLEDELARLQMYYNQRNEACACGERNGSCNCGRSERQVEDVSQYYARNDSCHRHRLADNQPKTELS